LGLCVCCGKGGHFARDCTEKVVKVRELVVIEGGLGGKIEEIPESQEDFLKTQ